MIVCEAAVDCLVQKAVDYDCAEMKPLGFHLVDEPARLAQPVGFCGSHQDETHGWRSQERRNLTHPVANPLDRSGGGGEKVGDGRERVAAGEALQLACDIARDATGEPQRQRGGPSGRLE